MPLIGYVIAIIIGCSYVLSLIMLPFVGMVSGKYFDKQFVLRHKPLPSVYAAFSTKRTIRGITYLGFVLFNQVRFLNCRWWRKEVYKKSYANKWLPFNYREIARTRDWVIGILFFSGITLLFSSLILAGILGKIFHY